MRAYPDGLELDTGMASSVMITDWERGLADLAKPRVLVLADGFDGGSGPGTPAPAGIDPEAASNLAVTLHTAAGDNPMVLLGSGFPPALLGALVIGKLRGMIAGAAAVADGRELAAASGLCGGRPAHAVGALADSVCWGRARRIAMTRNRTWIWAPDGWKGWESTASGPQVSDGTLQGSFDRAEAAILKAMRSPFRIPVSDPQAPALPAVRLLAGDGPAGTFGGRILLLGSPLTAADAPALAGLARKAMARQDCLVLALTSVGEDALGALAGGLGALAGRILVGPIDPSCGEDLALATGGRYAAPELLMTAAMLRPEDLGTFTGARLSGGGLHITGRAKPQECAGHLRILNRDYLLAGSDAEREALRLRCERFAGMLDPGAMLAYLRRAAEGKW